MHFTHLHLRKLARATLALLLFAQGVVAAQACVMAEANPVQAFAPAMEEMAMQGAEHMSCHEQPAENKNACLVHCTQADQISAEQAAPVFMPSSTAVLVVDAPAVQTSNIPRCNVAQVAFNSGPPIPIRFCTFLI